MSIESTIKADFSGGLRQLWWSSAGRRVPLLGADGPMAAWLLCGGGTVDLNQVDPATGQRELDDHRSVRQIGLRCDAESAGALAVMHVRHQATRRRGTDDSFATHHEWRLAEGFRHCFFLHDRSLVEFPLQRGCREAWYWCSRDDPKMNDGRVLAKWHGHLLFHDSRRNLVSGLVLPPGITATRLQIGVDASLVGTPFLISLVSRAKGSSATRWTHEVLWIAYRPADRQFWWLEGLTHAMKFRRATAVLHELEPVLALPQRSIRRGQAATLTVLSPLERRRPLPLSIERMAPQEDQSVPSRQVRLDSATTRIRIPTRTLASGVYRLRFGQRSTCLIVHPDRPRARILCVLPTCQWRSYSANGYYYGGRLWPFCFSFGATVMQSPAPGHKRVFRDRSSEPAKSPDYMPPWWDESDRGFLAAVAELPEAVDYCGQEAIHFRQIDPRRYRAVIYGPHAEYHTDRERQIIERYLAANGAMLITGGDNFGRCVSFVPDRPGFRYQRVHPGDGWYRGGHRESLKFQHSFGPPFAQSPSVEAPGHYRVIDADHPITAGMKVGQALGPAYWEGDYVTEQWRQLVILDHPARDGGQYSAALAVHRHRPVAMMGPMGWTDLIVRQPRHRPALVGLFRLTVQWLLGDRGTGD